MYRRYSGRAGRRVLCVFRISAVCFHRRPSGPKTGPRADIEPKVTLIVTAYNEARDIRQKLENTLLIDYPKEKLEIIVVSDHSNDGTDAIVREFETRGVVLLRQPTRGGKTAAENSAVEKASGEIIVFSDATSIYETRIVREMLPNFADASVGCVAGRLVYADTSGSGVGVGARSYWSFESFLKKSESAACSLIGASGCLYAVRRVAYKAMYPEACSDFLIATVLYKQGLRTIYEEMRSVSKRPTGSNAGNADANTHYIPDFYRPLA